MTRAQNRVPDRQELIVKDFGRVWSRPIKKQSTERSRTYRGGPRARTHYEIGGFIPHHHC